ncbi:MAG: hypothetical protein IPN42_14565 [Methylococcaceae bacterium]|nr:hypothetical protein [Methylococcaceae bacterium]
MIKNVRTTLIRIAFLFGLAVSFQVSANSGLNDITRIFTGFHDGSNSIFSPVNTLLIKSGEKYDESKDPALRRGTENTEQPQSSFFAIPATIIGIIGLVLFFNRNKE